MSAKRDFVSSLYRVAKRYPFAKSLGRAVWPAVASTALRIRRLSAPTRDFARAKGVSSSAAEWSASCSEATYKPVDRQAPLARCSPFTVEPEVHESLSPRQQEPTPPTFLVSIPNGRVCGEGAVFTPDGRLLAEVSPGRDFKIPADPDADHPALGKLVPAERVSGRVAVLAFPYAGTNYYHWMLDSIARIDIIRRAGCDLESIDWYYVSDAPARFHRETIDRLGIDGKQVLAGRWRRHVVADELIVPSLVSRTGAFPRRAIAFQQELWWPRRKPGPPRRYYLNRNRVTYRRVLNEAEIEERLAALGFQSVAMEDYSVSEQAEMMYDAEMVAAPHGAALANLMFCRPGAAVIELHNRRLVNNMYWAMCGEAGLRYGYLLSKEQPKAQQGLENMAHLHFDVDDLERLVGRIQAGDTRSSANGEANAAARKEAM